jgi:hypothetical protein
VPSANPATVTVSPPEPSAIEMPSGSGSLVRPLVFDSEMCCRTQWFYSPKAVDQFPHRVGESQQRNSNYADNRRDDLRCQ